MKTPQTREDFYKEAAAKRATITNRQLNQPAKEVSDVMRKRIANDPAFSETRKKTNITKRK